MDVDFVEGEVFSGGEGGGEAGGLADRETGRHVAGTAVDLAVGGYGAAGDGEVVEVFGEEAGEGDTVGFAWGHGEVVIVVEGYLDVAGIERGVVDVDGEVVAGDVVGVVASVFEILEGDA